MVKVTITLTIEKPLEGIELVALEGRIDELFNADDTKVTQQEG